MPCSFAELFYPNSWENENYDMKHVVALCKITHFCSELGFLNPAWFDCWGYQGGAYFYPFIDESVLSRKTYFTHPCQLHPCFITYIILCLWLYCS